MITSDMPKQVLNMNLTPTQGSYSFDPVNKTLSWEVGKINPQKLPSIKGSISLQSGAPPPEANPTVNVQFSISTLAISGVKVNRLDMYGEVSVQNEIIIFKYNLFISINFQTTLTLLVLYM